MPYQPTGRPPGRPKKPQVEREGIQDVRAVMANTSCDRASVPMDAICPDCFPDGWTDPNVNLGPASSATCRHGIWVRRF